MFKVGDRVRYVDDDNEAIVLGVNHYDRTVVVDTLGQYGICTEVFNDVELVNEGPVREVTRREIVPGNYGKVRVTEGRYVHCKSMSTAEELREAAHILNQLAEAME